MRLENKVCLVTGAASGMGRAAVAAFAREGAKVAALDISEAGLQESINLAQGSAGEVLPIRCDVTKEQEVAAAVQVIVDRFGRLDVLYNNAGIMMEEDHSVIDTEEGVWDKTLAVNVKGIYLVCKYGIPELRRSGGGSIINIASFVAMVGCSVPQDAYTASKGAVIALTKSLAVQFGHDGIRSNAICPGPIETPLMMEWLLTNPEAKAVRLARIPAGRFGRTEDIVNLGIFLASAESSWTNGAVMVVDGGITSNYF